MQWYVGISTKLLLQFSFHLGPLLITTILTLSHPITRSIADTGQVITAAAQKPHFAKNQIKTMLIIIQYFQGKYYYSRICFQRCYGEGCNKITYFRCIIHKKFNTIQKARTSSAHLQLPIETKTTQTEIVEFWETGDNNGLSSQALMRAVVAGSGEKSIRNSKVIALILHLDLKLFKSDM